MVKIVVGNLPHSSTGQTLRSIFKEYDDLKECYYENDLGFLIFETEESGIHAVNNYNGMEYRGFEITVDFSDKKSSNKPSGRHQQRRPYGSPMSRNFRPSMNQNFRPPMNQNFSSPMNQNFRPPMNQNFSSPMNQNFRPPMNQNFSSPMNQNFRPPMNQNFSSPMNQNFCSPMNQELSSPMNQNFSSPMNQHFGSPMNQNFGSPMNQNFLPPTNQMVHPPRQPNLVPPNPRFNQFRNNTRMVHSRMNTNPYNIPYLSNQSTNSEYVNCGPNGSRFDQTENYDEDYKDTFFQGKISQYENYGTPPKKTLNNVLHNIVRPDFFNGLEDESSMRPQWYDYPVVRSRSNYRRGLGRGVTVKSYIDEYDDDTDYSKVDPYPSYLKQYQQ